MNKLLLWRPWWLNRVISAGVLALGCAVLLSIEACGNNGEPSETGDSGARRDASSSGDSGATTPDGGRRDGGRPDGGGGTDAGAHDAGGRDGGGADAGVGDAGQLDGGKADGGTS
jgi:hypothetical protein